MVNQLQLRLPALKSWQWDRNWEIEILKVYVTLRNNSNVPPKDYRGTMNTKQGQLRIWGSSSDDCPTTWSTSGLTCRIPLGQNPGLEDLAKFFKRQAAIKNYRGFAGVVTMPTTETRAKKKKPPNRTKVPPDPRQISSFATDFSAKDSGRRPGTGDRHCKPLPEYRAVCVAQVHINWHHASSSKTKICKPAGILWNTIGCVTYV